MLEVMDAGVIDWGVDFIQSRKLQAAWEALLESYANLDREGIEMRGKELVNHMLGIVNEMTVEVSR